MNELIKLEFVEGEARVSHDLIANGMGVDAKNVRQLIDAHSEDFESFGVVSFETTAVSEEKLKQNPDAKPKKIYYLNEQQATLAMTYMRNSEQARAFKMALVRAFYAMKSKLEGGLVGGGNALELLAASQKQLAEGFSVMAESIKALSDSQERIIELVSQLQSNTPVRMKALSGAEGQKMKFVCLNPEFHDNPEEREIFTVNIIEILKRYPSGLFQGMLLSKSDYGASQKTRRWLQDSIGEFWNMEFRPGRGYLYYL